MQAIWAETDKKAIEKMTYRAPRIAAKFDNPQFTSSEDSSGSDSESNASFLALPPEFRPNELPDPVVKTENERAQNVSNPPATRIATNKTLFEIRKVIRENRNEVKTAEQSHLLKTHQKLTQPALLTNQKKENNTTGVQFEYVNVSKNIPTNGTIQNTMGLVKSQEPNTMFPVNQRRGDQKHKYNMKYSSSVKMRNNIIWRSTLALNNAEESSIPAKVVQREACKSLKKKQNIEWTVVQNGNACAKPKSVSYSVGTKKEVQFHLKQNEDRNLVHENQRGLTQRNEANSKAQVNFIKNNFIKQEQQNTDKKKSKFHTPRNNSKGNTCYNHDRTRLVQCQSQCGSTIFSSGYLPKQIGHSFNEVINKHSYATENDGSTRSKSVNHVKSQKSNIDENYLILSGKEISDLVVGSHIALSVFFSIYNEWKATRNLLIKQFEQLKDSMRETSKKYTKYTDLLSHVKQTTSLAAHIPHPAIGIAAKIVSIFTGFFMNILNRTSTDGSNFETAVPDIILILLKDKQNSEELYMSGFQCNTQFQETTEKIKEFHSAITSPDFEEHHKYPDILDFMIGLKDYRPKHHTFYKKLHRCYQDLLKKGSSPFIQRFCEPFFLYESNAVDMIEHLNWRFIEIQEPNMEEALKEIQDLTQKDNDTSMKDITSKIENCVFKLSNELQAINKCVEKIYIFDN